MLPIQKRHGVGFLTFSPLGGGESTRRDKSDAHHARHQIYKSDSEWNRDALSKHSKCSSCCVAEASDKPLGGLCADDSDVRDGVR